MQWKKKKNFHRRGEKCYSFNIYEFGSLGLVCCFSLFPAATNNYSLVNSTIAYVKNINCELEVVFMFFSLFFNPFQNAYFSFQKDFFFPFIRCAERVAHNCAQNFKIIQLPGEQVWEGWLLLGHSVHGMKLLSRQCQECKNSFGIIVIFCSASYSRPSAQLAH